MPRLRFASVALIAFLALGLGPGSLSQLSALWQPGGASLAFTDVTASAGIRFTHTSGAFGKKYLPETMGSGVVFLDADGDGWQDLFFVNSKHWPGQKSGSRSLPALYRNTGQGTFADITKQAGLAVEAYGMGGAAADYDNDGDADLFVTASRSQLPLPQRRPGRCSRT